MNNVLRNESAESNLSKIERIEASLLHCDQVQIPLTHRFAPGIYMREVFMPANTIVIGHEHKTEHFNIILQGRATVMMDGVINEIKAPCTVVSKPGVRKVLFIHEDMIWATIHPTEETDFEKLEDALIVKSDTFRDHDRNLKDIETMKQLAGRESK